ESSFRIKSDAIQLVIRHRSFPSRVSMSNGLDNLPCHGPEGAARRPTRPVWKIRWPLTQVETAGSVYSMEGRRLPSHRFASVVKQVKLLGMASRKTVGYR